MVFVRQARWLLCACVCGVLFGSIGGFAQATKPDLVVKDVDVQPLNARAQDTITIRAVIANTGRTRVDDRFEVTIKMDDVRLATTRVQLPARQERTVEANWQAQEGEHVLTIELDVRDQVDEKDERNNLFTLAFNVTPLSDLLSYTRTALLAQAIALEQVGAALTFNPTSTNLLLLLDLIKKGFDDFSKAGKALVASMQAISQAWPAAFADADLFTPLLPYYAAINEAAAAIQASLDSLDLPGALAAMGKVEDALRALAQLNGPTLPLSALAQAADALHLAIEAGLQAQERFSDSSKGSVDEAVLAMIGQVTAFAQVLGTVAQALDQSAQVNSAQFADGQGQTVRQLNGAIEVNISASGSAITFELINAAGGTILTLSAEGGLLSWNGADGQGQSLAAQTYFYRVSWQHEGALVADVGTLSVSR